MAPLLLLVDLQRDYLDNPALEPPAGPVVSRAITLLEGCRAIGVPVTHAWTTVSRREDRRMAHWKREGRWLCEEGTAGHAPAPGLEPRAGEDVVHKTSFSAFAGGDADRVLGAREVDLVVVAGVHLHGCVRQAVLDLYERLGADIWVAEDATASDDPVHAAITRRYLERRAARFLAVEAILEGLRQPGRPSPDERGTREARDTVRSCHGVLEAWRDADPAARARPIEQLADRLEPEAEGLAEEMAITIGKPVRYGAVEVRRTAEMLRAVARHATAGAGADAAGSATVPRRPLGVVAVVTPWNNPVYIPFGKIAPALAFGNAVVWKPAPSAAGISERLVEWLEEAGFPRGVVGLVQGDRGAAEAVMSDPGVDAVTLTGSSAAGFCAQEICARRRVPLQAELGGNNAALVWPDADLEHAAAEIAEGAFALAGQRCTANRRVVVHRDARARLLELLERETAALPWGDPRRPETRIGPLATGGAHARVAGLVARSNGAASIVVPHGESPPDGDGFADAWYPPTIIACDEPSDELVQRESFGPLLVVQTASDWEHAIALVNGVPQGLVAALFSGSEDLAARFPREVEAGIVKINRSTADAEVDVPFGGWKASGVGPPEHGSFDREFYTRPQVVYR